MPSHDLPQPGWKSLPQALALVGVLSTGTLYSQAADIAWQRKSSTTGDLPPPNAGDQQTCNVVADFNGDGIADFVIGERTQAPSVVWYAWNGKGWDRRVIDDTHLQPEAGGAAGDVDGDGDLDVILARTTAATPSGGGRIPARTSANRGCGV